MKCIPVLVSVCTLLLFISAAAAVGGDEGWIEVRCNVDGASVMFNGEYKGVTAGGMLTVPVYTTGSPYTSVTVEKAGYTTYTGSLTMPAAGETTTTYATLNPIPTQPTPTQVQYGWISVDSQPTGAQIYFNGNYRGLAPLTINSVWPGSYTIRAEMSGYHSYTTTTTVSSGMQSNVFCPLSPMDTPGSLYVTSTPSNANIYLDTVYKGHTPMTISNIASGTHILEVDTAGYYDWKSTVDVPAGGTRTISATLNPMPSSTVGWIYVSSSPGGASVTLDGNAVGQTPNTGSLKLNNVAAGEHTVGLSLAGYSPYSARTSVSPNTVSEVSAILQPGAPVSGTGALDVTSTPAGANVLIDNQFMGITPLNLYAVATGTHTVTIQMAGYTDYMTTTPVNAGATSTVSAALVPATAPTQKSPLPLVPVFAALGFAIFMASRKFR
jgi:hypothetical protein